VKTTLSIVTKVVKILDDSNHYSLRLSQLTI